MQLPFELSDQAIVFSIMISAVILFIWDKWRYDIVALLALFASVATGVVPVKQAFNGFSDPVVVTVAAVLVISAAVSRSGFINVILKLMSGFIDKPKLQIFIFVGFVMVLSAFMNNVGALAVFLPIAIAFARKAERKPSELLMPISFGSLLGGLCTLIGTPPNLLASRVREDIVGAPYEMFDFAPVGLGLCVVGIIYLCFGWKLLPKDRLGKPSPEDQFSLEDYVSEVEVVENSKIIDKPIAEAEDMIDGEISVIGLIRDGYRRLVPSGRLKVRQGDHLLLKCDTTVLKSFVDATKVELAGSKETENILLTSDEVGIVEAVIQEGSPLIGYTPSQIRLRSRFGLNLLAVRQAGHKMKPRLRDVKFRKGDVIVLQGNTDLMPETLNEIGALPLAERSLQLGRKSAAVMPVFILGVAVALTVADILPIQIAFLGGVILIAIMKLLRMDEIYHTIDGSVLILLGAMIPVTQALQDTGGSETIATFIAEFSVGLSGPMLLTVILVATMLVTPFLNNAATVLLMAPIAAMLASKLGLNVDAFIMAVAVGASCDFLTPVGHQSNTLVMGPGGYKFTDYWRLGLPLSILIVIVGVPLILATWPL